MRQSKARLSAYTGKRVIVGIECAVALCRHPGMAHYGSRMCRDKPGHRMGGFWPLVNA